MDARNADVQRARYLEKQGFSTLRLSMYGGGEKSRNISDSDVMTHASDIDDVVAFAKERARLGLE
jgi:very-short-patch-repair endonuclease